MYSLTKTTLFLSLICVIHALQFTSNFLLANAGPNRFVYNVFSYPVDQQGYATDGIQLWKFDTKNQGNTPSTNPITVFPNNRQGSRGGFATTKEIFLPQGYCALCPPGVPIGVVDRATFKVSSYINVTTSRGVLTSHVNDKEDFALLLDYFQLNKLNLNTKTFDKPLTVSTQQNANALALKVAGSTAYILVQGLPSSLVQVDLSSWRVVNTSNPYPTNFFPDNIVVEPDFLYIVGLNLGSGTPYVTILKFRRATLQIESILSISKERYPIENMWKVGNKLYLHSFLNLYEVDLTAFRVTQTLPLSQSGNQVLTASCSFLEGSQIFLGSGQQIPPLTAIYTVSL